MSRRLAPRALAVAAACAAVTSASAMTRAGPALVAFEIAGDAIPAPLAGLAGDAGRGRQVLRDRETGNCLICHRAPEPDEHFMGDLGPDLSGVGSRLTPGQIRLRVVDQSRVSPATLMPPYYRVDGLVRVAPKHRGKPVLDAQQIEDVVAYLSTLR